MRWTTGVGIAVGGTTGALAALLGSPEPGAAPAAREPAPAHAAPAHAAPPASSLAAASAPPTSSASATSVGPAVSALSTIAAAAASATSPPDVPPTAPSTTASPIRPSPTLQVPASREALLKAMVLCDQKQDFDECARVAMALDLGSAGPADPEQAKRFRRIALTHLVAECEEASPHACFVLAAKYRAGTELPASAKSAEALEQRGLELCSLGRSAPECPRVP